MIHCNSGLNNISLSLTIPDDETSCPEPEEDPEVPVTPSEQKFEYPDGGWGWVVSFGSALSHFLVVGIGRSFGLFYLTLLDMFQDSAAATSLVVSIYNTTRQMLGKFMDNTFQGRHFDCLDGPRRR